MFGVEVAQIIEIRPKGQALRRLDLIKLRQRMRHVWLMNFRSRCLQAWW